MALGIDPCGWIWLYQGEMDMIVEEEDHRKDAAMWMGCHPQQQQLPGLRLQCRWCGKNYSSLISSLNLTVSNVD